MKYADMAVPSRALHLWRYTPWARIHPSNVTEVPEANGVRFKVVEGGELVDGALVSWIQAISAECSSASWGVRP